MLISQVADEDVTVDDRDRGEQVEGGETRCQTASDLFDIMSRKYDLKFDESESLTTRDLVLLYKNIELGTQLMTNANELKRQTPNQYVETVIYHEDHESDDSDVSEIYGTEDLHNIILINKERIDLLNTEPSIGNTLCQKCGDLQLQNCGSSAYDRNFLLKDALKEQLQSLSLMSNSINSPEKVLPDSLLDYVCCKRLEDNYNFYMENIITYVKHTIEQLKRISNGDYLTDKAKAKWKEVETSRRTITSDNDNSKVLAKSTSIPLHVERKVDGNKITWDDIVHSEVDVRSLSKLLEKKIILEMPKIMLGSYRLFSRHCSDNLVISCKRELKPIVHEDASRVDVYLRLKRSNSESYSSEMLALPAGNVQDFEEEKVNKKVEQSEEDLNRNKDLKDMFSSITTEDIKIQEDNQTELSLESVHDTENTDSVQNNFASAETDSYRNENSSDDELNAKFDLEERQNLSQDTTCNFSLNNNLRYPMQSLNIIATLPEEVSDDICQPIVKNKSFTGIRIKSPYENKSYKMDEKKRRRLLEIREKREKKKLALNESSKITKHKFYKSSVMPQATSSVTKLSITNKSFYNSIYGSSTAVNASKQEKIIGPRSSKVDFMFDVPLERQSTLSTPDKNSQKYINRSYYLDDTVTEIMFTEINEINTELNVDSRPTASISNEFTNKFNILPSINNSNDSDVLINLQTSRAPKFNQAIERPKALTGQNIISNDVIVYNDDMSEDDKLPPPLKCRKSIDKIYNLIKKTGIKPSDNESTEKLKLITNQETSIEQGSESGTSLKHHLISSIPSNYSFNENTNQVYPLKSSSPSSVVPKVIISTKQHISEENKDHSKKEGKKHIVKSNKVSENPIHAISKLLQEIDNVQRTKQKTDLKVTKKIDSTDSGKGTRITQNKKQAPIELMLKSAEPRDRHSKILASNKKSSRLAEESIKNSQEMPDNCRKSAKKKISELLDEVKEARGEAVRGPSKLTSRLNTLAQPKKIYVQAHREEYQSKYGKNFVSDRLQRLEATSTSAPDKTVPNIKKKSRRSGDQTCSASTKQTSVSPLERPKVGISFPFNPNKAEKLSGKQLAQNESHCKRNDNMETRTGNKVGFIESYINHNSASAVSEYENFSTVRKSRIPLIPNNMEIESLGSRTADGSSDIGMKLHEIVNNLLEKEPSLKSIQSKHQSKEALFSNDIILLTQQKGDCMLQSPQKHIYLNEKKNGIISETEENIYDDTLYDKNTHDNKIEYLKTNNELICNPALEMNKLEKALYRHISTHIYLNEQNSGIISETEENMHDDTLYDKNTHDNKIEYLKTNNELISNPAAEMNKLEKALYRHISTGTFQKRLRIKNLTLTPKQSMQQIVVLHSGDTGSLVLKNILSENIKITASKSAEMYDLKKIQAISNNHIDWTFTNIPMQISTIGYALPVVHYESKDLNILPQEKSIDKSVESEKKLHSANIKHTEQKLIDDLEQVVLKEVEAHFIDGEHKDFLNGTKINVKCNQLMQQVQSDIIVTKKSKEEMMENNENQMKSENDDLKVDYSTSFDMLVGLLSEIQKITTCQTNITNNLSTYPTKYQIESDACLKLPFDTHSHDKTVCKDLVSITTLDKLRNFDSDLSLNSCYLSNSSETTKEASTNVPSIISPASTFPIKIFEFIDKEVDVNIPVNNIVDTFTATSQPYKLITEDRSTSVSLSFITLNDCPSPYFHSLNKENAIVHNKKNINEKRIIAYYGNTTATTNEDFNENKTGVIIRTNDNVNVSLINNETNLIKDISINLVSNKTTIDVQNEGCLGAEMDPIIKMKQEILGTTYCILVFVVFAALSLPDLMWYRL